MSESRREPLRIETQLGCFGYHGFGGGYSATLYGVPASGVLYCSEGCSLTSRCWERHRQRVRELFPDRCGLVDAIARQYKGVRAWQELAEATGEPMSRMSEPYAAIFSNNIEDGAAVALGRQPRDRGPATLSWPLTPLEEQP